MQLWVTAEVAISSLFERFLQVGDDYTLETRKTNQRDKEIGIG